tara:strand:+ start:4240 stop:4569 length:330 start_codon:yes stop_codon:yes gene_type:complete
MTLEISKSAADQIGKSIENKETEGEAMRIAARRLEDGTIDYAMGIDVIHEEDFTSNSQGLEVIVAPTSDLLLTGARLDYVEMDDGEMHFIFLNPNDPNYSSPPSVDKST